MAGAPEADTAPPDAEATVRTSRRAPEAAALEPGALLNGRYRVTGRLGRGATATVYAVEDALYPERRVALKLLTANGSDPRTAAVHGLLEEEFRTIASLAHPHVARVYDFEAVRGPDGAGASRAFFTLERVDGRDALAATDGAPLARVVDLVLQACRALAYVHARGLVHGDLKPAHLLVEGDGALKIIDFGVAAAVTRLRAEFDLVGSPLYMPPEQASSDAPLDPRGDLYALGATAFHLLARRPPFAGSSVDDLVRQHASAPLAFEGDGAQAIPPWLRGVLVRLLAKRPRDRYGSATEVIEAIQRDGGFERGADTSEARRGAFAEPRFVGRELESARLGAAIEARLAGARGAPPAVVLRGPSGMGKSRLLREARREAQLARRVVLAASCYAGPRAQYGDLAALLEPLVLALEGAGHGALVAAAGPALARVLPAHARARGWGAEPALDEGPLRRDEAARARLRDGLAAFVVEAARALPFVWVLDDLQWVEPASGDAIEHILRAVARRERGGEVIPLACLGGERDDAAAGGEPAGLVRELRAAGLAEVLVLPPLGRAALGDLVASVVGVPVAPAPFVARLERDTAGNPFVAAEVVRSLLESGAVAVQGGAWTGARDEAAVPLPCGIGEALRRRLADLAPVERRLVALLAVRGRPAAADLLTLASGLDAPALHTALGGLVERALVVVGREGGERRYSLAHDRLRDSVQADLDDEARRAHHLDLARALEELARARGVEAPVFDLAEHHHRAGDLEPARRYALEAGCRAADAYAHATAIPLLERVADDDAGAPEHRAIARERLADMLALAGAYRAALARLDERLADRPALLDEARLRQKRGAVYFQQSALEQASGELWRAAALLGAPARPASEAGLALATGAALARHLLSRAWPARASSGALPPDERARLAELCRVYTQLAYVYYYLEPRLYALPGLRGLAAAERLGPSRELSQNLSALAIGYATFGRFSAALDYAARGLAMAEGAGSAWHRALAIGFRGHVHYYAGRSAAARADLERARAAFRALGDHMHLGTATYHLASIDLRAGELSRAQRLLEDAAEGVEEAEAFLEGKAVIALAGVVCARRGDSERGVALCERALRIAEETSDVIHRAVNLVHLGEALLESGRVAEASDALDRAAALQREHQLFQHEYLLPGALHGIRARLLGAGDPFGLGALGAAEGKRLARAASRALVLAERRCPNHRAAALGVLAWVRWAQGHARSARGLAARALAAARAASARWDEAVLLAEAGRRLVESPDARAAREGARQLAAAADLFAAQGAEGRAARAQAALARAGPPVRGLP